MKKTLRISFTIFFLILVGSLHAYAQTTTGMQAIHDALTHLENSNKTLLESSNQEKVDATVKEQIPIIQGLIETIKKQSNAVIDFSEYSSAIKVLRARISINESRGNSLAVERDKTQITTEQINIRMLKFVSFLIHARTTYADSKQLVDEAEKELKWLSELVVPQVSSTGSGQVYSDLATNYFNYTVIASTYSSLLQYVVDNDNQIAATSWLYYLKIGTLISTINTCCDVTRNINQILQPIRMSVGKLVVAACMFALVCFFPLIFSKFEIAIQNVLLKSSLLPQKSTVFYTNIHIPLKYLFIFSGISIGVLVIFYGTGIESYVRIIDYIIYSLLFIYLLFNIIDATAILHLEKVHTSNPLLREEFINLFIRFAKFTALLLVISTGLNHYGIKMTAILSTLGLGGLAFALAAKDTLSNFFGGITVLMDDVFRQGDWIKVNDLEGTVVELGIRSTTVRSFENALITVPNSLIANQNVTNWNRREVGRRIKMTIGVTYDATMKDLQNAVQDIRNMLKKHPKIAQPTAKIPIYRRKTAKLLSENGLEGIQNTQLVYFDSYGDFSLNILIYCFSKTTDWAQWLEVKEDVLYKINDILKTNHLSFAYPTQVRISKTEESPQEPPAKSGT